MFCDECRDFSDVFSKTPEVIHRQVEHQIRFHSLPREPSSDQFAAAYAAGRWARRKERICRPASGIRSLGSFQGNMLTSALGASIAASMATLYGCAGMSSGRISTGVWQLRTKSRVTVKTKSGLVRYIFVRNFSTIAIVMPGRRLTNAGPQPVILVS